MVFLRGLTARTISLSVDPRTLVEEFKSALEEYSRVPRSHWHLTYAGKPLEDSKKLQHYGISADATIQLAFRLLGGKGGFGSLLRGAGRAILTDNVDACRDLSGRRLRQANAEKRLAQWAAEARERELEKVAMKHVREQEKANKREQRAQTDSEAVKREQQEALDRVTAAVIAAQEILAGGTLQSGKRKASMQVPIKPAKRARIFGLEELSDSETDSEDDEEIAMFEKAGQLAAAGSSGLDSSASDFEAAPALGQTSSAAGIAPLESTAKQLQSAKSEQQTISTVESRGASAAALPQQTAQPALSKKMQSGAATTSSSQANAALLESEHARQSAAVPTQAALHSSTLTPQKKHADLSASSTQQPAAVSSSAAAPAAVALSRESQEPSLPVKPGLVESVLDKEVQQQKPIDLAQFDSAEQLEAVGMDGLKAELQRHGMKCGGTVSERAARLFLLKDRNVKDLDRKHLAK